MCLFSYVKVPNITFQVSNHNFTTISDSGLKFELKVLYYQQIAWGESWWYRMCQKSLHD